MQSSRKCRVRNREHHSRTKTSDIDSEACGIRTNGVACLNNHFTDLHKKFTSLDVKYLVDIRFADCQLRMMGSTTIISCCISFIGVPILTCSYSRGQNSFATITELQLSERWVISCRLHVEPPKQHRQILFSQQITNKWERFLKILKLRPVYRYV